VIEMKKKRTFQGRFLKKTSTLMMAAFGFVAALAWNDAIQSLFKTFIGEINQVWAKFIYAVIVTLILVIVASKIEKYSK
jgi:hypothetical protein